MNAIDGSGPAAQAGALRWVFSNASLDERTLQLLVAGVAVTLEPKPLQLLMYLLRRSGEVVTRQEILDALWPGRVVTDGVINNCVAKLRAALGDEDQELVRTVPRYGYRFDAEVRAVRVDSERPRADALGLVPGRAVPNRPDARLVRPLADQGQSEVWLVALEGGGEQRVFKFARDAKELALLKREITLNRVLLETHEHSDRFVRVLSWNLDKPPFYLEFEFVPTGNLSQWCEARGGAAMLPIERRIELAAQCASAVADAHSAGVLHKDLKPSNILVASGPDGEPRVRLCDFGAGTMIESGLLDQLSITRMGFTHTQLSTEASGTPLYLAPEQFSGHAPTVQSDVYALGVLLYQLVVGDLRRVLAPGWELQIEDPLLREDIAAAANGDPAHRLHNAGQLADRLRKLAARRAEREQRQKLEAQAAADQQALQRAQARRGLLQALSATLAIGALAVGGLYLDARRARDLAREEAATTQAVVSFLTDDLLAFANPRAQGSGDLRVRDLLDAAEKNLAQRFTDRPIVRARLQRTIGGAYGSLGLIDHTEANLLPAIQTLARELGDSHPETQSARIALRDSYRIVQRYLDILPVGRAIRSAEESAGRVESALWFEGAWSVAFGECIQDHGAIWLADCGQAIHPLTERARVVLGNEHPVTARLLWIEGVFTLVFERSREAAPLLAEAQALMLRQMAPDHPRVLEARMFLAAAMLGQGDLDRAEPMLREVAARFAETMGEDHDFFITAQFHLGRLLLRRGRLDEAESVLRQVWNWRRQRFGFDSHPTAFATAMLIETLIARQRADEALRFAESTLQDVLAAGLGEHPIVLRYQLALAQARNAAGDQRGLGQVLEACEQLARRLLTRQQWYLGLVQLRRAEWLRFQGEEVAAKALLAEAVPVLERSRGAQDRYTRQALEALAGLKQP